MEQQPQIGTLQQAGCAACPNQWGIGCKNTIYIYILYTLYMYILDGPGWIESQCDRHIGHTQNDITLMFTVSERSMSLQQGIHSA